MKVKGKDSITFVDTPSPAEHRQKRLSVYQLSFGLNEAQPLRGSLRGCAAGVCGYN